MSVGRAGPGSRGGGKSRGVLGWRGHRCCHRSQPTTVLCRHCPIAVPSHHHPLPLSSCPISPIPPQSHTAIISSHCCHPHPTLLSCLSLSHPTATPSHHPPHTILPPSCLVTVLSHPCPMPSPTQCPARGGDHPQATRVLICLGPPACATRLCHTGSCCPCPLCVPPNTPPSTSLSFGGGNCMLHVPPTLSHVPACVPAGQGGLALPPEPAVPPSCRRSRGALVPPPSSPFGF